MLTLAEAIEYMAAVKVRPAHQHTADCCEGAGLDAALVCRGQEARYAFPLEEGNPDTRWRTCDESTLLEFADIHFEHTARDSAEAIWNKAMTRMPGWWRPDRPTRYTGACCGGNGEYENCRLVTVDLDTGREILVADTV